MQGEKKPYEMWSKIECTAGTDWVSWESVGKTLKVYSNQIIFYPFWASKCIINLVKKEKAIFLAVGK